MDCNLDFAQKGQCVLLQDPLRQKRSNLATGHQEFNPAHVLETYMEAKEKQGSEAQQSKETFKRYCDTLMDHITNLGDSMCFHIGAAAASEVFHTLNKLLEQKLLASKRTTPGHEFHDIPLSVWCSARPVHSEGRTGECCVQGAGSSNQCGEGL